MTTTLKSKPQYKTINVVKDNGQTVQVSRCALSDLELLMEAQERLVTKYVLANGALGKLLLDEEVVADMGAICAVLPVVGKEAGYLSYEEIAENWEQLVLLFFNGGFNVETGQDDTIKPSKVSQLHFLPYMETVQKAVEKMKAEKEE